MNGSTVFKLFTLPTKNLFHFCLDKSQSQVEAKKKTAKENSLKV
jgi:hypothetical protein